VADTEQAGASRTVQWVREALARIRALVPPRVQRMLEWAVNGLLLGLVGLVIYQNRDLLPILGQSLAPHVLLFCLGLYFLSLMIQAAIWIDMMGYRAGEYRTAVEDYIQTTLMGRLPGGVWKLLGRITLYRAPRLSVRTILAINIFELFLLMLAAGIILFALTPIPAASLILVVIAAIGAGWVSIRKLAPVIPGLQRPAALLRLLLWLLGYMLAWLCGAAILYLLVTPFSGTALNLADALRLACASGVVNLIFQFLPVSLLFRDLTLVVLLVPFMSQPQAIVAIFALRLVSSICELISSWLLLGLVRRLHRHDDVAVRMMNEPPT
jgi:hypothetical protein